MPEMPDSFIWLSWLWPTCQQHSRDSFAGCVSFRKDLNNTSTAGRVLMQFENTTNPQLVDNSDAT